MHPTCAKPHRPCPVDAPSLCVLSIGDLPSGLPNTARARQGGQCSLTLTTPLCGTDWKWHSLTGWLTDLICAPPSNLSHAHAGRPVASSPSPIPHHPKQLTSVQPARQRVSMPEYQRTDVPSYPEPRWEGSATRLHPALLRSSLGMPSKHARVSKDGLPPPAPSRGLPTYPDILLCNGYDWQSIPANPSHTMPDTSHGSSSYNRRCRQFKATTLAYWHTP